MPLKPQHMKIGEKKNWEKNGREGTEGGSDQNICMYEKSLINKKKNTEHGRSFLLRKIS